MRLLSHPGLSVCLCPTAASEISQLRHGKLLPSLALRSKAGLSLGHQLSLIPALASGSTSKCSYPGARDLLGSAAHGETPQNST